MKHKESSALILADGRGTRLGKLASKIDFSLRCDF